MFITVQETSALLLSFKGFKDIIFILGLFPAFSGNYDRPTDDNQLKQINQPNIQPTNRHDEGAKGSYTPNNQKLNYLPKSLYITLPPRPKF